MNGTYTKPDAGLTLEGTWKTSEPFFGLYVKIVAGNSGDFTEYLSADGASNWYEAVKGTYPDANPAVCTITHVNTGSGSVIWTEWNSLSDEQKQSAGGSETFTAIIYTGTCEIAGYFILEKQ
jgi:hypothetical protein